MLEIGDYVIINVPNPHFVHQKKLTRITGISNMGLYITDLLSILGESDEGFQENWLIPIPKGATEDQIQALRNLLDMSINTSNEI